MFESHGFTLKGNNRGHEGTFPADLWSLGSVKREPETAVVETEWSVGR